MATLELRYADLVNAIGDFLGFGTDYTAYTAADLAKCERFLSSGLRDFYYFRGNVDGVFFTGWSFMNQNPSSTLTLVAGTRTYDLPSNFSDMDGSFTWGDDMTRPPIMIVADSNIRDMYNAREMSVFSGYPLYAAIRAKSTTGSANQGYEVIFYPEPEDSGSLNYRYYINPIQVTSSATYPMGGPQYAEVIKECCIAAAERDSDDEVGLHNERAKELIINSARFDMQSITPEFLGRNVDRSDYQVPVIRST